MEIEVKREREALSMMLTGRLDSTTAPQLEEAIGELEGVRELALDFSHLEYLSSAGLRVLLRASKIMNRQGKMVIRHVNEEVREVLVITGFSEKIRIEE